MNRGHLLQSSPVQQMMAGSPPNWWNLMNNMRPPSQQAAAAASSSSFLGSSSRHHPNLLIPHSQFLPPPTWASEHHHHHHPELPAESWSQLLLGGLVGEEEQKTGLQAKKLENWEEHLLQQQQQQTPNMVDHLKQENSGGNGYNIYGQENAELIQASAKPTWSHQMMPVSSPTSCVTTLSSSSNMLNFTSNNNKKSDHGRHPLPDRSSECNSTSTIGGGAAKKARVQPSSTQSSFKVRKEKLGDRIAALHQLVSPFGKTDTASVLLEAIGYIRFLQSQIEALSVPYLGNSKSGGNVRQEQHIQGGERNSLFPEDPGQLLNDNCMKRKARSDQDYCQEEPKKKDLRSRGLCLVPLSCTTHVGTENGADYWASAIGGAGFR